MIIYNNYTSTSSHIQYIQKIKIKLNKSAPNIELKKLSVWSTLSI